MDSLLPPQPSPGPAPHAGELAPTPRTTLHRRPTRGSHERAAIDAILDEALVCHVAVNVDGSPRVLPTAHVRVGEHVYLHGARANRMLTTLASGAPCCLTATLLDGLVFSRLAFSHSMNYRSAVLYGCASEVTDRGEKRAALHALVEHLASGRTAEARPPTDQQLDTTLVVRLPISEGSAKARSGPPLDGAELHGDDCWAGELPLRLCALPPRADPKLATGRTLSGALAQRAVALGLGVRTPYERVVDGLLVSTDLGRVDFALVHGFLSGESYWARGVSEGALRRALEHSLCFGLYRGGAQIGFARVVTDFARFAYLGDVFIVAGERGRGLGKLLVEHVLAHPELAGVERWMLGTRDAHELYVRYGFARVPPGRFMVRPPPP